MASRFPNTQVLYKDTHGAGGITVRNIELQTNEDGFIEGPADLETDVAPHGFVRAEKWIASQDPDVRLAMAAKYEQFANLLTRKERENLDEYKRKAGKGKTA